MVLPQFPNASPSAQVDGSISIERRFTKWRIPNLCCWRGMQVLAVFSQCVRLKIHALTLAKTRANLGEHKQWGSERPLPHALFLVNVWGIRGYSSSPDK